MPLDRLSALLQRFDLRAQVFRAGPFCGTLHAAPPGAELHLLRQGRLTLSDASGPPVVLEEPAAIFYARPVPHQLHAEQDANIVCAHISFGAGDENPLLRHLPARLVAPLVRVPGLALTQQLLFDEAFGRRCGHGGVVDRLAEVLMVQLLRHAIAERLVDGGLVGGLSDERLARALAAVHAEPARAWTLDTMAREAGMSRARFSARFSAVVGLPPGEYLTQWRLGLARRLLRRGHAVKQVASEVGYSSSSALARVFRQREGRAPSDGAGGRV
jgi:AraC-like DNA-binding protein